MIPDQTNQRVWPVVVFLATVLVLLCLIIKMFLVAEVTRKELDKTKNLVKNRLVRAIRTEIETIGAGAAMPEFNRETKQRPG